jgi:hypothetical protein
MFYGPMPISQSLQLRSVEAQPFRGLHCHALATGLEWRAFPTMPRFELKNTSPLDPSVDRYTVAMGRVETRSLRPELRGTVSRQERPTSGKLIDS